MKQVADTSFAVITWLVRHSTVFVTSIGATMLQPEMIYKMKQNNVMYALKLVL